MTSSDNPYERLVSGQSCVTSLSKADTPFEYVGYYPRFAGSII